MKAILILTVVALSTIVVPTLVPNKVKVPKAHQTQLLKRKR